MNNVERSNDSIDILRSSDQYKFLRECFITNYNTFKEKPLDERTIATNISENINRTWYATIDIIVKEHLESLEQMDYWVLNVSVYTAAYTIKKYVRELKTTATKQNKNKETPKWTKNIETSIENTRKFIGKLTTVIACKKSSTYSKNQKRLKDMFEKQFGNTKVRTLEYKFELYKQKLKASCAKLKYQKILHQRKVIKRQSQTTHDKFFTK